MGHMDNYVEVKDRIVQFYKDHPKGSLRCKEWKAKRIEDDREFYRRQEAA